mmetsp:Transcript_5664/g.21347  ORF Transcript_5664/g.21347 Transcript_5664/m.21347 type:complete len:104 (-) Transcript_5664:4807-5118(-)
MDRRIERKGIGATTTYFSRATTKKITDAHGQVSLGFPGPFVEAHKTHALTTVLSSSFTFSLGHTNAQLTKRNYSKIAPGSCWNAELVSPLPQSLKVPQIHPAQ